MRHDLVGYLLSAVEDHERARIDEAIEADDSRLKGQLESVRLALRPLACDEEPIAPPAGLAERTIRFVQVEQAGSAPRLTPEPSSGPEIVPLRQVWLDRMLIAAAALAACVLLAPLLLDAIEDSRSLRVERKLGRLSAALHGYGDDHRGLPAPPPDGPLSRAGLYGPTLVAEHRLVADDGTVLIPGSPLAEAGHFRIPTLEELEAAVGTERLEELVRRMGGDFGYTLGHRGSDGRLAPIRDRRRAHHPLMADAPEDHGLHSSNHPDGLHHVLFEDGSVKRIFDPKLPNHDPADDILYDHLYHNHDGVLAAGVDDEDSAIGGSHHRP